MSSVRFRGTACRARRRLKEATSPVSNWPLLVLARFCTGSVGSGGFPLLRGRSEN